MASTYSSSLRIELIGAGDQAGTWNTTTNTNLGTIIESAIAGYVSVSVTSANQAFTALDGAPDQARNAVIALTTTTGANFNVYAPPQEKTYIIYNTTAYTATIYNSTVLGNTTAAGVGIAVPAGGKVLVFSDGTNFYSTSAADLTGAVTSVGTVTSLGSFTSAQLLGALTDETGTGANVFAASPTFTGTPLAPTASFGTSTTQLATTAFVQAAFFPSGTAVLFAQTAAPTGFTKSLTHNNKALRVVTGAASSGGSSAFTTVFTNQTPTITTSGLSAGATTLTTAQLASHDHGTVAQSGGTGGAGLYFNVGSGPTGYLADSGGRGAGASAFTTTTAGGGSSHDHTITGTATSTAITLDVQYVDVIIATKD
jgi:hypothetical protein